MRHVQRLTSLAVLLAICGALAGCGGGGLSNFDPTDLLDFLDTKKKLPGDRKPVFPEGVPGLTPGVPKDLYKGARAEPEPAAAAPVEEQPKGRKAAKSRSPVRVAPPDANVSSDEGEPAAVPAAPSGAKPKIVRRRTTAPSPDPEPAPAPAAAAPAPRQPPAQTSSPFPAPLPSGTFSR